MKNKTFILTLAAIVLAGSGTYFLVQQYLVLDDVVESEIEKEVEEEIQEEKNIEMSKVEIRDSETPGWKIYQNNEWGFEIQYPDDWKYLNRSGGSSTPFGVIFLDDDGYYNYGGAAYPGHYPKKFFSVVPYQEDYLTLEQYVARDAEHAITSNTQEVTISETSGIMLEKAYHNKTTNKDMVSISAYTQIDDYIFIFTSVTDADKDIERMKKTFNEILYSFIKY